MKVAVEFEKAADQLQLHFSRDLPVFPSYSIPENVFVRSSCVDRSSRIAEYAASMAAANSGAFCVEVSEGSETYHRFLQELVLVKGVVQICFANRYAVVLQVGRCFDARRIAVAVARVVCKYFYPGNRAVVSEIQPEPVQESSL